MALRLEQKTLIHEVVGSSPAQGISAPQRMGVLDYSHEAGGIGQTDSNKSCPFQKYVGVVIQGDELDHFRFSAPL